MPVNEEQTYRTQELTEAQEAQLSRDYSRFIKSRDQRDDSHDGFDGMDVDEWVEFNAKTACSYIEPRQNSSDISIVSGIPREKMLAIASNLIKLNLMPEVIAYDRNDDNDAELGRAFTNLLRKANDMDGDEEKQLLRFMYLLEQGTIFIEEAWVPRMKYRKTPKDRSKMDPATGFKDLEWYEKKVISYHAERKIWDLTQVYLGDITQYEMSKQPYIFTREVMHYDAAKAIFGEWQDWDCVQPGRRSTFGEDGSDDIPYRNFRLYELEDQQVEILKIQDPWNDEYQIYINGIAMLPAGFGLPWNWEAQEDEGKCYSITKTVLEPISPFFPYGKSMMAKIRVHAELLDEMLRLLVHKTKQSVKPPVGNMTGQALTPRIFDPGTLWDNVNPDKLKRIVDHQGVTASEYQLYNLIRETVDNMTVSPTFQGQQGTKGGMTATEVLELQRQARLTLGMVNFSVRIMEERINYLRVQNVLENWTSPLSEDIDLVNKIAKKKYRSVSYDKADIGGKVGTARVIFTEFIPTEDQRKELEYELLTEERSSEDPKQTMYISLPLLFAYKRKWKVVVNPSERQSSEASKVLLAEEMGQAMNMFGPQAIKPEFYKKKFANAWGNKYGDVFMPTSMGDVQSMIAAGMPEGAQQGAAPKRPGVARPTQVEEPM